MFHFLGLNFLSSFSFCPSSCHVSIPFTYTPFLFSFPFSSSCISSFLSCLCPAIHLSPSLSFLSLCFVFHLLLLLTFCSFLLNHLLLVFIACPLFCYCFPSTAGLTTQACSPIRRPSQSGLWCWETSNGQDQRLHTGWDPSVVMETVSLYQFPHVSQVCMLLLVFLSTCFVTFWDILILFTLLDFIQLYIKMSYS